LASGVRKGRIAAVLRCREGHRRESNALPQWRPVAVSVQDKSMREAPFTYIRPTSPTSVMDKKRVAR